MPVEWSIGAPLTLLCGVRWIVRSIKRSEMRRGHESVREPDVRRKLLLEVVIKRSRRASGHILLKINRLLVAFILMCYIKLVMN
jgi:hypothetical protein